jgi:hypothetical protein
MSTKTTFKRIALVAVAALGFGMLSVVPSQATSQLVSNITVGAIPAARAGSAVAVPVTFTLPSGTVAADTFVVAAKLLDAPLASAHLARSQSAVVATAVTGSTNADGAVLKWAATAAGGTTGVTATYSVSGSATGVASYAIQSTDSVGSVTMYVLLTPDVSGSYTVGISVAGSAVKTASSGANQYAYSTSDISTAFAVTTGGSASTMVLTPFNASASAEAYGGSLIKLTLTDSTGAASTLGSSESIRITTSSTTATTGPVQGYGSHSTAGVLTYSNFVNGVSWFKVYNTATEDITVTVSGNGTLSSLVTTSTAISFRAPSSTAIATTIGLSTGQTNLKAGTVTGTPTVYVGTTSSTPTNTVVYTASTSNTSQSVKVSQAAAPAATYYGYCVVHDTSGKVTGVPNASYGRAFSISSTSTTFATTCSASAVLLNGEVIVMRIYDASADEIVQITGATKTATTMTVTPSVAKVATKGSLTITGTLTDQFSGAIANATVTISVAGRNATTTSTTAVTDALGQVTYTLTDAGSIGTIDTVTFLSTVSGTSTVTWGTGTAGSVALEGPNDDDTYVGETSTGISAGATGAQATAATVTATVKDANGVILAGIPVTFTVSGTTAAIKSTHKVVYSATDGTAGTSVYAWAPGEYTVTATAGGQTATNKVYFKQSTLTAARTISAAVAGNLVTATVKDRYGNAIKGVYVYATRTGSGTFGNGLSTTSGTTDADGKLDIAVNGSAVVTVALGDSTAADKTYGQSSSAAGYVGTTAVTATTVGTAFTAETGVGASFAPAGINSATVTVEAGVSAAETAADAAAEATDAANAATDAANAAAEAADAATAAAQDAADAVAALSAQVASLISGLKSQLTALTNLVIKIQKKVKA